MLSKWFWLGALTAFLIFLSNLLWNIRNHWPFLELIRNIRSAHRDVVLGPFAFLFAQLLETKLERKKIPCVDELSMSTRTPQWRSQWYADQFGFKEIADAVEVAGTAYLPMSVPTAIFGQNNAQAGALDFFGRPHGLPGALSGDRTYYLWGPRGYSGNCMIVLDDRRENLQKLFEHVDYVGTSVENRYALEGPIPVFLCKGKVWVPSIPLAEAEALILSGNRLRCGDLPGP